MRSTKYGERVMTEANALRHYIRKGNHFLRNNDAIGFRMMLNESSCAYVLDVTPSCNGCPFDEIGKCGANDLAVDEIQLKFCFPSIVKDWEDKLNGKYKKI